ncbi:Transcriptional activator hac1 [Drechmeria coniospora]|uniref:Transcriptional activator hac1 n=1 Tax=Drechmeria coniospora TaxID=98403 RepID=A0A151GNT0_DRECN|nr:Transcriptional activator hac1 [Drechmeria coniospora]KYK58777.1 Transcriptional activator hac1 [Drechmeria coniospora]
MEFQSTSPTVKYEQSPLEAYVPASGDDLTSLFTPTTPSSASTMNPLEMMTPQSYSDDRSRLSVVPEENTEDDLDDETPAGSEKKAKKRKSWGQVLPEPKTNLPPRKRAKTDDEKEQRRVERVLRNRRAAQSSRERKRLEVEALEKRNKELETLLLNAQKANLALVEELNRVRRDSGVSTRSSSPLDSLRDDQVTLSQQLFGPQDKPKTPTPRVDGLILSTAIPTVNPASISPERSPVPDAPSAAPEMPDVVRPAVSNVGGAAQVVPELADSGVAPLGLDYFPPRDPGFGVGHSFGMPTAADADRYVLESGLLSSPISSTLGDDYMAGDYPAGNGFDFFNMDDFLHDEANHVASDIVAASNFAAADHGLELHVQDAEIQVY